MEYDYSIKYDNRPFCEFYLDKLKDNQLIINIFKYAFLNPVTMKLLLLLNIELYFFLNGLFCNEKYMSDIFFLITKKKFLVFFQDHLKNFYMQ